MRKSSKNVYARDVRGLVLERNESVIDVGLEELTHVVVEARVVGANGLHGGTVGHRADTQLLPSARELHLHENRASINSRTKHSNTTKPGHHPVERVGVRTGRRAYARVLEAAEVVVVLLDDHEGGEVGGVGGEEHDGEEREHAGQELAREATRVRRVHRRAQQQRPHVPARAQQRERGRPACARGAPVFPTSKRQAFRSVPFRPVTCDQYYHYVPNVTSTGIGGGSGAREGQGGCPPQSIGFLIVLIQN